MAGLRVIEKRLIELLTYNFKKLNIMSHETVLSVHDRIANYKPEKLKGYVTRDDIKHFVTACMVYKVIAPFLNKSSNKL